MHYFLSPSQKREGFMKSIKADMSARQWIHFVGQKLLPLLLLPPTMIKCILEAQSQRIRIFSTKEHTMWREQHRSTFTVIHISLLCYLRWHSRQEKGKSIALLYVVCMRTYVHIIMCSEAHDDDEFRHDTWSLNPKWGFVNIWTAETSH